MASAAAKPTVTLHEDDGDDFYDDDCYDDDDDDCEEKDYNWLTAQTSAANVNMHHLPQAIWGSI